MKIEEIKVRNLISQIDKPEWGTSVITSHYDKDNRIWEIRGDSGCRSISEWELLKYYKLEKEVI